MRRVLAVDDEPHMLEGWNTMVNWDRYGYELSAAASCGEEALALAKTIQPELVFTDIRMPGIDGLELIRRLREVLPLTTRIVIMSGYSEFEYVRAAMPYKIECYMLKPLIPEEVHSLLYRLNEDRLNEEVSSRTEPADINRTGMTADRDEYTAVDRILVLLQAQYRDKIRITELARQVGHHPDYLGQLFKRETGHTILEYIHMLRIDEAKRVLRQTDMKIAAVADLLGYHDAEAFTAKFKRLTSATPSEYRTSARLTRRQS